MKISTKGRYALRIMVDLSKQNENEYITLKDIVNRQDISMKYAERLVGLLNKAKLLKSSRGPQGGCKLNRKPEEYTVGEILRAVEGSLAPVSCLVDKENKCPRYKDCETVDFWQGFYNNIDTYFDSYTLLDVVNKKV